MMRFSGSQVPILIICRDKLSPLVELVEWLEFHGYQRVVLVDNASTYPPLLDYFDRTPHEVVRLPENLGPYRSIWDTDVRDRYARGSYYVVTDCDVIPDPGSPGDAVAFFHWALSRFPTFSKAGFGLRIDDLPDHYELAEAVRRHESQFWTKRLSRNLYEASIDTTFALYRPDTPHTYGPAIRTGKPYVARHQPWYMDSRNRTEEEQYYSDHCDPGIAHWDLEGHRAPVIKKHPETLKGRAKRWAYTRLRLPDRTIPRRYRPQGHQRATPR